MESRWTKRRKVLSMVKVCESNILKDFEKAYDPDMKESTFSSVAKGQNVALTGAVSATFSQSDASLDADFTADSEHDPDCDDHHDDNDHLVDTHHADDDHAADDHAVDADDDDDAPTIDVLMTSLRFWASTFSVSLVALTALLGILRAFHPELPRDARTILRTQGEIETIKIEGGEYYHFGLASGLMSKLKSMKLPHNLSKIKLQFNIDGLPLFKSSKTQFWPILSTINLDLHRSPFIVGLFCGFSKPKGVLEFLGPFIKDLSYMIKHGIVHNGQQIMIEVCSFVCDAPARAFVKNTKSHNGYSGCDKCFQVGEWHNKMTYPDTNVRLRTDTDFNSMIDEDHHLSHTLPPLAGLVKMVTMFPLDYMHLCCLGVTRKLLYIWIKGRSLATRLSGKTVEEISRKLMALKPYTPSEFSRKPRQLSEIDRWKATELRYFMLYAGPVVLRGMIPLAMYNNFMLFSVAMHLLLSPQSSKQIIDCAEELLVSFVRHFGQLYGRGEITYNVHQLTHLAAEYRLFGPLDNISAFPYENYLGQLKRLLRKPHLPLQQVIKRLSETPAQTANLVKTGHKFMHPHHDGPLTSSIRHGEQYHKLLTQKYTLSSKSGDNCFQIFDEIVLIENIVKIPETQDTFVIFRKFTKKESFGQYPFPSESIGVFTVWGLNTSVAVSKLQHIGKKYILYPDKTKFVAVPIVHTN